jgi:hypothetical protein
MQDHMHLYTLGHSPVITFNDERHGIPHSTVYYVVIPMSGGRHRARGITDPRIQLRSTHGIPIESPDPLNILEPRI